MLPAVFFVGSASLFLMQRWCAVFKQKNTIRHHTASPLANTLLKTAQTLYHYTPNPFLLIDYHGHLHTMLHTVFRELFAPKIEFQREVLMLSDGGSIAVDTFHSDAEVNDTTPVIILFHGICGNSESHYIQHAAEFYLRQGYIVVAYVARGCGGVTLTSPFTFTAARTSDLHCAIAHIHHKYPSRPLFAVGYSLGAALLLKYLGDYADNCPISAAVAMSPPWNFHVNTSMFNLWSSTILKEGLRGYLINNLPFLHIDAGSINIPNALKARNVRDYDHWVVVPSNGYRDVDHYYTDASPVHVAHRIKVPTLAISAMDDPVCSWNGAPTPEMCGEGLVVVFTKSGGHVAFGEGCGVSTCSYMERASHDWFTAYMKTK